MKRTLVKMLLVLFCSCLLVAFTGCEGDKNGENHTHEYFVATLSPTCIERGCTVHICACGDKYVDTYVNAVGHEFTDYVSDNNATYESDGTKTATCTREGCGEKSTVLDEGTKIVEYYNVTYLAQSNGIVLNEDTLSKAKGELIEYTAPEILGYTFVGWSDNVEDCNREDNSSKEGEIIVANYEIECLDAPVIVINTKDCKGITSKTTYVECEISILNTDEEYCLTDVSAGIRGRGNSTWNFEKKPYRIKFDKKQSLFGSSYKQKSWTLLANYADKSLSRNVIAYELGERFEGIEFSSIHEFVEVFLNGKYLGVYLLCDQIQTGDGRVDVDEDFVEDGDTGYLLEMDARAKDEGVENVDYFTVSGNYYAIKTPDTEDGEYDPDIYVPFIKGYFENCLNKLNNGTWEEIQTLMDVDSFVENYIVQELFANTDVGSMSFYLYKQKGGKLYCGPLWDFDIGAGNSYEHLPTGSTEYPADYKLYASTKNIWFRYFCKHQEFKDLVKERLQSYSSEILEVIEMVNPTNENGYYKMYENAFNRNFEKWAILDKFIWNNPDMICTITTVEGQLVYLRDWLKTRYYFLCLQYA